MACMGYRVRVGRGGEVTYYHPRSSGHDLRVRGIRLGDAYTREGVTARFEGISDGRELASAAAKARMRAEELAENMEGARPPSSA
ncbi:hypothetical protein [Olsenella sp. Marseille-P4559]|uniref:hypothetical protein n=1 Tax=Olsenella sp. Marseille-P4559 TaxID=2364795 RepID=UPI001032077D|nr:hypothetical protein [Olsenella sp. Marseille-P4559]